MSSVLTPICAAWCTALACTVAHAQSTDEARTHLERAKSFYAGRDYEQAIAEFEIVYGMKAAPSIQFNLGQAWRALGEYRRALDAYARFLAADPEAAHAEEARRYVLELAPLAVEGAPPAKEDRAVPRISHVAPAPTGGSEALLLEATIRDPSGVFEPRLYYRSVGSEPYVTVGLRRVEEHRHVGAVPPLEADRLEYYFEAYDKAGNGPSRHGTPDQPHVLVLGAGKPRVDHGGGSLTHAAAVPDRKSGPLETRTMNPVRGAPERALASAPVPAAVEPARGAFWLAAAGTLVALTAAGAFRYRTGAALEAGDYASAQSSVIGVNVSLAAAALGGVLAGLSLVPAAAEE